MQNLTGQINQLKVSGSRSKKSPFHCFLDYVGIKQTKNRWKGNQPKPTSRLQLMCAIWMNVQYVHAALSARRAWPSFSCRCVSTGEACQTPGSPFQRCQRTCQVLSGARIENKGGKNKGGEGVFVVSTKAIKGVTAKTTKSNGYCTFLA